VAKILVADDNSNIQKMVGLALKDQGIDVVAVGNGEAAVRKISDIHPDLVLADVFMPVRNGYEVCRYVKEDSTLSHIPVILLVGAFDPLDEQEAQRVGADGVLKKPFVPPDPLISMVKSALTRAGVPLGPASTTEKAPPVPKRSTADILSGGAGSKFGTPAPEKLPEASPEPLEEFPTTVPHLKIAAGSEPLAFGSLLDTSDAEDLAITAKPMINLSEHGKWDEESDEVEEEKEEAEEGSQGGWRPGGLDEAVEHTATASPAAPDWREEAFHGNSPAKSFSSNQWASPTEQPEFAVAIESQSVAVATEVHKTSEAPSPFTSDAWAAAMAAGVEEKLGEIKDVEPVVAEAAPEIQRQTTEHVSQPTPEVHEQVTEHVTGTAPVVQDAAAVETAPFVQPASPAGTAEPANWAQVPETAWEMEAKKASLLASTWDAPKPVSVDDTQEVPAYAAEVPVEHIETSTEVPAESSAYSAEPVVEAEQHELAAENEPARVIEAPLSEPSPSPAFEAAEPKSWENAWEAPAAVRAAEEPAAGEAPTEAAHVEEQPAPAIEPAAEMCTTEPVAARQLAEPDMDELVARVLGKMNPEVLQRVTREILKPVIEAIVRDEINSKKP
jgi:CheY-like chemotaxis protein